MKQDQANDGLFYADAKAAVLDIFTRVGRSSRWISGTKWGELVLSEAEGNPLGDAIIIGMMIIISVSLFGELLKR